ncbi:hypothetical protein J6590_012748 [Homalodisca vitripennis]|nr:hypothetical protein J6590_012748 [Homalodisca vitripennis]
MSNDRKTVTYHERNKTRLNSRSSEGEGEEDALYKGQWRAFTATMAGPSRTPLVPAVTLCWSRLVSNDTDCRTIECRINEVLLIIKTGYFWYCYRSITTLDVQLALHL